MNANRRLAPRSLDFGFVARMSAGDTAINLSRDAMDVDAEAKRFDLLVLGLQLACPY